MRASEVGVWRTGRRSCAAGRRRLTDVDKHADGHEHIYVFFFFYKFRTHTHGLTGLLISNTHDTLSNTERNAGGGWHHGAALQD